VEDDTDNTENSGQNAGDDYDPRDEKLEEGLLKDEEDNCYSMNAENYPEMEGHAKTK